MAQFVECLTRDRRIARKWLQTIGDVLGNIVHSFVFIDDLVLITGVVQLARFYLSLIVIQSWAMF